MINLEFLWRFKANRNTCSSMPIKKPTMLSRAVPVSYTHLLQLNEAILEAKAAQEEQEGDTGAV